MQLTIDSDEPLEDVLKVLGAIYQVDLSGAVPEQHTTTDDGGDWRTPKPRHG